jgi:hypothetical protein
MTSEFSIRDVRFVPAPEHPRDIEVEDAGTDQPRFAGFVSAVYGDLVLDGFGLHLWPDGRYSISFPTRKSPSGKVHRIVRATSTRARYEVERRLLVALESQGVLR